MFKVDKEYKMEKIDFAMNTVSQYNPRNKNVASLLAIFLGWTGVHKFYLGKIGLGVMYAIFSFTFIPFFLSLIDFFVLLSMNQEEFDDKYNDYVPFTTPKHWDSKRQRRRNRHGGKTIVFDRPQSNSVPQQHRPKEVVFRTTVPRTTGLNQNKAYHEGIRLFEDYQYRNALESFNKALMINRDHAQILFYTACCNSLLEQKEELFANLEKAVKMGFKDFEKIQTMDALAYFRIQKEYDSIKESGFRNWNSQAEDITEKIVEAEAVVEEQLELERPPLSTDELLAELKKLGELRQNGELTDEQFAIKKQKLFA